MTIYAIVRDIPKGIGANIFSADFNDEAGNYGEFYSGADFASVFSALVAARGWKVSKDISSYEPKTPGYPKVVSRSEDATMFYCALINDFLASDSATAEWAWGETWDEAREELISQDGEEWE